jgi:K+-sensing histidine kinase KdpD
MLTIARRVNHDLRAPLSGIISANEALKEELTDAASLAVLNSALKSSDQLGSILQRISFVVQASVSRPHLEKMVMHEAVSPALIRLRNEIAAANAKISQPQSWPEVSGVSEWLEMIWRNLVLNALKYAGPAPQIELGWGDGNGECRFWVSDQGQGVPTGQLRGLFTPFDRLHELNAPRGWGLSIVQRLVELQKGRCGYEVNRQGGACFFFVLPEIAATV